MVRLPWWWEALWAFVWPWKSRFRLFAGRQILWIFKPWTIKVWIWNRIQIIFGRYNIEILRAGLFFSRYGEQNIFDFKYILHFRCRPFEVYLAPSPERWWLQDFCSEALQPLLTLHTASRTPTSLAGPLHMAMLNSKAASIQPPWQMAWYLLWLSKLAGGSVLTTSTPGLHIHLAEMRQTVNHFQAVKGPDHMLDGASWRLCIQHCCCTAAFLTVRVCQETDSYVRKLFGRTNCDNSNSCSLLAVSVVTITFQVHQLPWRQCYCWSSHLRHYAVSFTPVQIQ